MKKLYNVQAKYDTIIYIDEKEKIIDVLRDAIACGDFNKRVDCITTGSVSINSKEIKSIKDINKNWSKDCVPWSLDLKEKRTIEKILKEDKSIELKIKSKDKNVVTSKLLKKEIIDMLVLGSGLLIDDISKIEINIK